MRKLLFLALATLPLSPGFAQDAVQADTHDALAAWLVAVLPPSESEASPPDPLAVERAAALSKQYPAKSAAIAAAFADRVRCSDGKRDEAVGRVMLAVARMLSDDDLRAMIAFYSGPDHIAAGNMREDSPEWAALLKRYPLTRFGETMQAQAGAKMFEEVLAAEEACQKVLDATLAGEGIEE